MTSVVLGHIPLSILGICIFGFPNINGIYYILLSAFLHFFYQIFLLNAYKYGELSEVYPIARGISPLIITLISLFLLSENISIFEVMGILLISVSILTYGLHNFLSNKVNMKGIVLAICTGCFIASYSLVDGHGARVTQNPIGFFSVMTLINGLIFFVFVNWKQNDILKKIIIDGKVSFFIGGSSSFVAYGIVVWACLYLPIAIVSSIRETSIIFALLLGIYFLKEKLSFIKLLLIFGSCFGITLMRMV